MDSRVQTEIPFENRRWARDVPLRCHMQAGAHLPLLHPLHPLPLPYGLPLPGTCTLTAVPLSPVILLISRYLTARGIIHDLG